MRPTNKDFELAKVLLNHSVNIKPKEKVLITTSDLGLALAKAVYAETLKMGAYPMLDVATSGMDYTFYNLANDWQLSHVPEEIVKAKIAWADAYVRIVADDNLRELSEIAPTKMTNRAKLVRPLMDPMIDSDRWILTYYPTNAMAQEAGMSLEALLDFYYDACLVNYTDMKNELKGLEKVMDLGSEIHVVGKMTDLLVGISGRLSQACYGERNIPDGECFLAPVTTAVNGEVYFELPTLAYGHVVSGIHLEFVDGKVVNARAEVGDDALQKMLETDPGARYLGEFAIGANYHITKGMMNTLFDEKIGGTIHMALGRAYKDKRGGGENESAIHWDLVKDMRSDGSVLTIDERVILENGKLLI
ncbi:MAG: aminopeptidase [bacterium]